MLSMLDTERYARKNGNEIMKIPFVVSFNLSHTSYLMYMVFSQVSFLISFDTTYTETPHGSFIK